MTTVLRLAGLLMIVLAGIVARMQATATFDPPPVLSSSLQSPVLAMELVRSADEARSVLRDPMGQNNRAVMRHQIDQDWTFIAAYSLWFALLGFVLRACRWPGARFAGSTVILLAVTAALCDVFENLGILTILDTDPGSLGDGTARSVRLASLAKWAMLAALEALLALLFLVYGRREPWLRVLCALAGLAFVVAALLGFAGLAWHWAIEWSSISLAVAMLAALPVLLLFPGRFLWGIGARGPQLGTGRRSLWPLLIGLALVVAGLVSLLLARAIGDRPSPETEAPAEELVVDEARAASRLMAAIRIKTISHQTPTDEEHALFHQLHETLRELFPLTWAQLKAETIGDNLLLTWQGSDGTLKPLMLIAHLDVVPAQTERANSAGPATEVEKKWLERAFGSDLTATKPYIYGRGSLDDKVSVVGILEAVEALAKKGFHPRRTILLGFGCNEEVGGENGTLMIRRVLESKRIQPECIIDEGSFVFENVVPLLDFPVAPVGIAEKGYVDIMLSVSGEGGHSSVPPSHTAIGILSRAITRIENNPMPARIDGVTSQALRAIAPRLPLRLRFFLSNKWFFGWLIQYALTRSPTTDALIRTTTAVTIVEGGSKDNVLPTSASAIVNARLLPGDSSEGLLQHVRSVIDDPRVKVEFASPRTYSKLVEASSISPTDSDSYKKLRTTIRQTFPNALVAPYTITAGTDARNYQGLTDNIYRFLPLRMTLSDVERIHGIDERIARLDFVDVIKFYYRLIRNFD